MTSRMPARSIAERKTLASSAVSRARSVGSYEAWIRPASIREKSSSVFTSLSRRTELRCASSSRSRFAADSPSDSAIASSSGPIISVSGVRNSWLMLAKNCVFSLSSSASSSRWRAISRSCAFFSVMSRPFGGDEHDVALLILHRHERGVDDDRFLAAGAAVDLRVPADEFALRRAPDRSPAAWR